METKAATPVGHGIGGMDNVVPQTPSYFTYIRYAQIVMTFVVFICGCVAVAQVGGWGWGGGFGIFTSIWTAFFLAAVMLIPIYATNFYYKWAALIAEAFCILWWLITLAGLAVWASALNYTGIAGIDDRYLGGFYKGWKTAYGASAAGAAFSAFNFVSFIVTFVLFGIACNKSRQAKRQYGVEAGTTSMGPIGQPTQQPAPQAYDPNYQQQQYPTVPTPAPQQPYHQ